MEEECEVVCECTCAHQCGSVQSRGEKGGAEVESVFCLGFSCSVIIDNPLSMLSECP